MLLENIDFEETDIQVQFTKNKLIFLYSSSKFFNMKYILYLLVIVELKSKRFRHFLFNNTVFGFISRIDC